MSAAVQLPKPESAASALLSAALHACSESIAVVESGRILYANRAFAEMYGCRDHSDLEGTALADFVPGRRTCTDLTAHTARECGYPACEFEATRRDGTRMKVQATCVRFRAHDRELLVISARDLSQPERRHIVRGSERRFRAIFDAAAIGMLECAMDGRVVECNPAAERMLGYTHVELRGMHFRDFTHPDDVAKDMDLFQEMVAGKRDWYQIEVRYLRKDKVAGRARLTVSLVRGPDGNPEFAIGMVEDVTEQREAERQLREAQKMEAIGRLVGGVAHDFNNLLTGIMLYCDLLLAGLNSENRLRHHAEEIRMAGQQGAALIQQLLSIARQQVVEPRVLSFNEIADSMRNLLSRLIGENIELVTLLADDLSYVKMDPAQVQQIILNLVLNARDAMPGGGRITLQTRNCPVAHDSLEVKNSEHETCIEFTVTDTGSGMDAETRARLFEPFFTTKKPGQGNGLGLTTVHNIVKRAQGTIQVESEVGVGTRVIVRLPGADENPRADGKAASLFSPSTHGTETVLLVEDDSAIRGAALRVLTQHGYEVLEARNGQEALERIRGRADSIDLLISDLAMPGMWGADLVHCLRSEYPNLRVLYISGYHNRSAQIKEQGFILFRKPFTGDALVRKVRELLDQPAPASGEKDKRSQP